MTNFERAVKLIVEEYREECEDCGCDIKELFRAWQMDTEDARDDFVYILSHAGFEEFSDDGEIFDTDGSIKTLQQLIKAVRNYKF